MAVPCASDRSSGPAQSVGLHDDLVRVLLDPDQRSLGPVGLWLRVCDPPHTSHQYDHQVRAACDGAAPGQSVGEQGRVPAVHRTGNRFYSRHSLRALRHHHDAPVHLATVRVPAHVLCRTVSGNILKRFISQEQTKIQFTLVTFGPGQKSIH